MAEDRVVGEIMFRTELTPWAGTIGIIDSVDVDVRYQKRHIGTSLVRRAEQDLAAAQASRVIAFSPPEAYNFWMKLGYFARTGLVNLRAKISSISRESRNDIEMAPLAEFYHIPRFLRYSNIAPPGKIGVLASEIFDLNKRGILLQFTKHGRIVGAAAVVKRDSLHAEFVADVMAGHEELARNVISMAARAASRFRVKEVLTTVPKDKTEYYNQAGEWRWEESIVIPVTKIL